MACSRAILAMGLVAALLSPAMCTPSLISMPTDVGDRPPVTLADGLSLDFHAVSCPNLQNMVNTAVRTALQRDVGIAAGLLRILFHDCFPQGCDASILLTGAKSEQNMRPNVGLRQSALQLIESIREQVHRACGRTVSCTDITNLATREAVMQSGVPGYEVPLGRLDSLEPALDKFVGELPGPDLDVSGLVRAFQTRGLDKADLVALSGAHTIGKARCSSFKGRFGENAGFVRALARMCVIEPNRLQDLDVTTPNQFDNKYYSNLQKGMGVFNSDMALTRDGETNRWVNNFAGNQGWFFGQFSTSMRKLAHLPGRNVGEIRANCFRRNSGQTVDLAASASA